MSSGDTEKKANKPFDLINRGTKRSNIPGAITFVGLRALDPLLQYGILAHGIGSSLLHKVGLETLPHGVATHTGTFIDSLGLSPYRLVLLSMAVGSSVKQIFWLLVTSEEEFPVRAALPVVAFNSVVNSLNSLLFTCALTSASISSGATFPQTPLLVGSAFYVVGILTEAVAEVQRKNFKKVPDNKGKVYTGGLWSLARHINYGAYTLWRTGYCMAAAGWTWGLLSAGLLTWSFSSRAIPVLDEYCGNKYGEQWGEFKGKVPYKLFPFIY